MSLKGMFFHNSFSLKRLEQNEADLPRVKFGFWDKLVREQIGENGLTWKGAGFSIPSEALTVRCRSRRLTEGPLPDGHG
jgi:hypothetical protein